MGSHSVTKMGIKMQKYDPNQKPEPAPDQDEPETKPAPDELPTAADGQVLFPA